MRGEEFATGEDGDGGASSASARTLSLPRRCEIDEVRSEDELLSLLAKLEKTDSLLNYRGRMVPRLGVDASQSHEPCSLSSVQLGHRTVGISLGA